MASTETGTTAEPWWSKLGIPRLTGNGKFVSAASIDSIGTGLIMAFTVVYFAKTTTVSLPAIGFAMTLARLLALPTSVTVGPLLDRYGPRRTAAAGNMISVVGYIGFLFVDAAWAIVLVAFLVQVGHTTFWTSNSALVALAAPEAVRTRWFGFVHALRNGGMGLGSALGALAFSLGDTAGLHGIAIGNAVSFLVAAVFLVSWHPPAHPAPAPAAPAADTAVADAGSGDAAEPAADKAAEQPVPVKASYRTVLRDGRYALLMAVNLTMVFAQMLLKILLAIYIIEALDRGAWLAGTLLTLCTVQVAVMQTMVSRQAERYRTTRALMLAALFNATAFGIFALLYISPDGIVVAGLFLAMIVFTFGEMVGFPVIDHLSVSMAPEHVRGRYLAVYQLSWTVGEIAAPTILTSLLVLAAVAPMVFLLVVSLLAIPLLMVLERGGGPSVKPATPAPAEPAKL